MPRDLYMNGNSNARYSCDYSSYNSPLICIPQNLPNASTLVCNVGPNFPVPFSTNRHCRPLDLSFTPHQAAGGNHVNIHLPQSSGGIHGSSFGGTYGAHTSLFAPQAPAPQSIFAFRENPNAQMLQRLSDATASIPSSVVTIPSTAVTSAASSIHEHKNDGVPTTAAPAKVKMHKWWDSMGQPLAAAPEPLEKAATAFMKHPFRSGKEIKIETFILSSNPPEGRKSRDPNDDLSYTAKDIVRKVKHYGTKNVTKVLLNDADINDKDMGYINSSLPIYNSKHQFNFFWLLDLSHNKITDVGVYYLMNSIFLNPCQWKIGGPKWMPSNVQIIDLSGNRISDAGVKTLVDALEGGKLPHLKKLDVSDNPITAVGYNLLAKALKTEYLQDMVVTLERLDDHQRVFFTGTKAEKIAGFKAMLKKAKDAGVDIDNLVVDKNFTGNIKNYTSMIKTMTFGFVKCHFAPDDFIDYAQSRAKDHIITKLPQIVGRTVTKWVDIKSILNCYLDSTDDVYVTPEGAHQLKLELELIGTNELYENLE